MLSLKLLGGASLERSGGPVSGRAARGHRLALLALLARGRPLSRDKALALLWPESDTDRGRRMLSDTLYLLRGAFGEDVVLSSGDDLRLNPERVASDVGELERLLDEGRPEPAVALYQGPFLDGFHLSDSAEFEEWADGERARLAGRYSAALEALAEASEAGEHWNDAVGWWRRLAAVEPGNGRIALSLMRALDAAGDRAGALQHARVHAAVLREAFDAEPDPEVVALTERLRRESVARPAASAAEWTDRPAAGPPAESPPPSPAPETGARTAAASSPRRGRRAAAGIVLIGLVLAGVAVAVSRTGAARPTPSEPAAARRSIAVLPFANLSADAEQDYFSDGLAEELIGALSRIEGLRVAARTSSFAVGGGKLDVRTIGDTLRVATVLEGSVRRDGRRLRVSARLADAANGYELWSEDYDRELKDVFAVQDEIARAIAGALEMRLAGGLSDAPARRIPTVEAHDLYLRGVFVRNQLTGDALAKAVDYFDRAIQLDSTYALAYTGKASALPALVWYGHLPRAQALPAMREAARRALQLDPGLGEAHVARGMLAFYFEWDWPVTEREFQRAITLNPSDQHAHHMYANYLVAMGRLDEGIAARRRALELDPLSIRTGTLLGRDYFVAGEYDRAAEQYQRMTEIDSTSPLALGVGQEASFGLGDVYAWQGRDADAVAEYLKTARLEGISPAEIDALGRAFAAGGLPGYWRRRLELELAGAGPPPEPLRIASHWARIGDAERTAQWVERAYEERSAALPFLGVLPAYDGVRRHPRIVAVLERLKLREAAERAARRRAAGSAPPR
ncbi:MAG TPA: BTAD domain-containing putative transcriptional regulator [Gemmatimonadales bacterium]